MTALKLSPQVTAAVRAYVRQRLIVEARYADSPTRPSDVRYERHCVSALRGRLDDLDAAILADATPKARAGKP